MRGIGVCAGDPTWILWESIRELVMIDVMFVISNIQQFPLLRTLGKDTFQEHLWCKWDLVMSTFALTASRCNRILAISSPHINKILLGHTDGSCTTSLKDFVGLKLPSLLVEGERGSFTRLQHLFFFYETLHQSSALSVAQHCVKIGGDCNLQQPHNLYKSGLTLRWTRMDRSHSCSKMWNK